MKKLLLSVLVLSMMGQAMAHEKAGKAKHGCHSHGKEVLHCH